MLQFGKGAFWLFILVVDARKKEDSSLILVYEGSRVHVLGQGHATCSLECTPERNQTKGMTPNCEKYEIPNSPNITVLL